jgi:hypothetical protein
MQLHQSLEVEPVEVHVVSADLGTPSFAERCRLLLVLLSASGLGVGLVLDLEGTVTERGGWFGRSGWKGSYSGRKARRCGMESASH